MRLIAAGLPRSGTLSQKVALEMLGLAPCCHTVNLLGDLNEAQVWRRALEREAPCRSGGPRDAPAVAAE